MPPLRFIFTLLLLFGAMAHAQPDPKRELAAQLFDRTVMPQAAPLIDRLLRAATREKALPAAATKIYRDLALETFTSPAYRAAYIDAYVQTFSAEELRSLLDLAAHPGFSLYIQKGQQITELTYPAYVALLNETRPELERRLKAAGVEQR